MKDNGIYAEVMQMAVVSMHLSFAVTVKTPVEMPPRVYNISYQELLVRVESKDQQARVIYEILSQKVLNDYNKLVEDSPIMDMFTDPVKYEQCSYVEFKFV